MQSGISSENGGLKPSIFPKKIFFLSREFKWCIYHPNLYEENGKSRSQNMHLKSLETIFLGAGKLERFLSVWEGVALCFVFVAGCFQSHIKNEIKLVFSGHQYWLTFLCILFIFLILHSFFYCQYRHFHYCWIQTKWKSVVHCTFPFHCLGNHERLARQTCEDT